MIELQLMSAVLILSHSLYYFQLQRDQQRQQRHRRIASDGLVPGKSGK